MGSPHDHTSQALGTCQDLGLVLQRREERWGLSPWLQNKQ